MTPILWHPAALSVLYRLHPWTAAAVDRSVIRFAETGVGHIEWVAPYHRLRAGAAPVAALSIARETGPYR